MPFSAIERDSTVVASRCAKEVAGAGSEVSALLGRIPSAVGYQPTLATDMGALQERITTTTKGSITSVQAIYVPADDLTDPAPATTFAHLDATTVLSRAISEKGIYPAVDPLDSTSRMLSPLVVVLAFDNALEALDRVLDLDLHAGRAGEHGGDVEGLRQEAFDLAGPSDDLLILFRQFVHAKDRDNVLQRFIALENLLHLAGDVVVLLADDCGG